MKTVILCGGKGTRIRGVNDDAPKPMIEIGPYPVLWHIMRGYAAYGHKDFVLCLGHKSWIIKQFFLNYQAQLADFTVDFKNAGKVVSHSRDPDIDWTITLAETGQDTMTGGRVKRIEKYIGDDEDFFLTYGDGVSDIDIAALLAFHRKHGRIATVSGVRPPGRFGELETSAEGAVTEFNEKPQATGGRISGGFFVCNRRIFDYLPAEDGLVLEQEPLRRLAQDGQLMMYAHDGFWQCMDTPRDHQFLNELWASGTAPWTATKVNRR